MIEDSEESRRAAEQLKRDIPKHHPVMGGEGRGPYRAKADSLARRWASEGYHENYDALRDATDLATGGELDCTQLDILASMVLRRLYCQRATENALNTILKGEI